MKEDFTNRLQEFRKILAEKELDGFIFSTTDEYLNEYVPEYNKRVAYLTGFKGSFAVVVVLQKAAVIFVDGRYILALQNEVDGNFFSRELFSMDNLATWLKGNLKSGAILALNSKVTSISSVNMYSKLFEKNSFVLKLLEEHLVDLIWQDRPAKPKGEVYLHNTIYGAETYRIKVEKAIKLMQKTAIDYFLITALDSIAWLLNIRGSDMPCDPLCLSKLVVRSSGEIHWFVDYSKTEKVKDKLEDIFFHPEEELEEYLAQIDKNSCIGLSDTASFYYFDFLKKHELKITLQEDICLLLKSKKNPQEIKSLKNSHAREGVYLSKLYYNIIKNPEKYTELSIDEELNLIKSSDSLFISPSFESIVGYNSNGAIVHYRATRETSKKLANGGYLLIDCGSQYQDGTTDVTRVISLATSDMEFKKHFTLVLKGHIAVASLIFKKGTKGSSIDLLARQYLWQEGLDYAHGTGHGIGFCLCVHEGPQSISPANNIPLEEGMIVSNEPGFYVENKYGIRIENLYAVKQSKYENFLEFDVLTLVPIDCNSIDFSLLNDQEKNWLTNYQKAVYKTVEGFLNATEKAWLSAFMYLDK